MRYALLIRSDPQPWGHPTSDRTVEYQALPAAEQERLGAHWDEVLSSAQERREIVSGWALGDPADATVLRYDGAPVASPGPYEGGAAARERLAGIFILDTPTRERAEEIAEAFSCPGDTIELRPMWSPEG